MSQPFFNFLDANYTYPGSSRPVFNHLNLKIEEGEFVALVGANGSGKTTLARHLNALLIATSGSVRVNGLDTSLKGNWAAIHHQVGMVFQFPEDQIVAATVEEDTAFGPENLGLPSREIRERVEAALTEVGLWEHRKRGPHLLSAGQMQRLALAGVLAMHPKAVIFDEATTMLDPHGRRRAMRAMQMLNDEGVTIVFVTHFMEEAAQAKRIIVLNHGQIAMDGSNEAVFSHPADLAQLGLELPGVAQIAEKLRPVFPSLPASVLSEDDLLGAILTAGQALKFGKVNNIDGFYTTHEAGDAAIDVRQLSHTYLVGTPLAYQALDEVSLTIERGECRGLAGSTGSGKSTLLQHLNGLLRPQHGSVRVGRFNLSDPKVTIKEVIQEVGLVFQNPESSFFERFTGDEIAYGPRQLLTPPNGSKSSEEIHRREIRERVQDAMVSVGLDFEVYKDRMTDELSGGERRKVALAAVLALRPAILAMDEPTAGLDPASRVTIQNSLVDLKNGGRSLVIATHQMDVLAELGDRMSVLRRGKTSMEGKVSYIFDQPEALESVNLEPPIAARVAHRLRQAGWPLLPGIITINGLMDGIDQVLNEAGR